MIILLRPNHSQVGDLIEYDVTLARLPPALDGFSIALLSDLHAGVTVSRAQLAASLGAALAQRPELVALVGDLMDGPIARLGGSVGELRACTRAPAGCHWVSGNHLFISGDVASWTRHVEALGIRALRNERVRISRSNSTTGKKHV